ncbi:hypothetical protein Poli38472_007762 [Pythium oligandrum]|uniref:Uncharacterized protein n=1 Tax=Pythium oligandrum TaxID=41045 RepID=A0A8K1CSU8_PYTOL|nr:hypothetical protein Poli38472_007762 [Pythium oligandrum]|eukprot:TMW68090.1 hypothetical protein Poli38472_007762 [Pythium oligandrum]
MHVRFVLSATHFLEDEQPRSAIAFVGIVWKLTLDDLRLADEEAKEFLVLKDVLPEHLQYPTLMEVILRECNGHIGAMRCVVDSLYYRFRPDMSTTEEEVLQFYLSTRTLECMSRCYGGGHKPPTSPSLQRFLTKCLLQDPSAGTVYLLKPSQEDELYLQRLMSAGIIVEDRYGLVTFVTPMAERFFTKWLFPHRATSDPKSVHDLVRNALASGVALESVATTDKATFHRRFLTALALHTRPSCLVLSNVSRLFPSVQSKTMDIVLDFYVGGELHWGLEVLVGDERVETYDSQFACHGKYGALGVTAYAVVDLGAYEATGEPKIAVCHK